MRAHIVIAQEVLSAVDRRVKRFSVIRVGACEITHPVAGKDVKRTIIRRSPSPLQLGFRNDLIAHAIRGTGFCAEITRRVIPAAASSPIYRCMPVHDHHPSSSTRSIVTQDGREHTSVFPPVSPLSDASCHRHVYSRNDTSPPALISSKPWFFCHASR